MAHFAEIGIDNIVLRVVVIHNNELLDEDGVEQEQLGIDFVNNLFGGTWKQTSYNGNFRKQFAGIGFTYNSEADVFIRPKPFHSWVLDENYDWEAPVAYPDDGNSYTWDEANQNWVLVPDNVI